MKCFCSRPRTYHCKIVLLDEQELIQEIQESTAGQHVLDTVFRYLNLLETAYFGLRYMDANNQAHWLDTTKKIVKQLKSRDSFTLYFGVKFYAVDPCKLVEEITRYQFFLQIKQDILQGRLPVSFELAAELGAYAVQSELGDYDPRRHSSGYVSEFRFVCNQTAELENKIAEIHKTLHGQLPAVAELNYLDKVKWLEMYGVDLHTVIGEDSVEYFLGLTPAGVMVLRNKNKVASYYWPKITKIYFKGKYFMLRVSEKNNEENTYGFETPSKLACKHLYKCCVEHHSFFRLARNTPNPPDVVSSRFSTRNDKLSGRSSQLGMRNPPNFTRTPSRRYQRRIIDTKDVSAEETDSKTASKENITADVKPTSNTNNTLYMNRSDSPRSTRSAPWGVWSSSSCAPRNSSSHSPRSVRSAGPGPPLRLTHARRSSSVESQSSNDSRPCRRHKHRSRRGSDNESDLSRCSGRGHRRHRHRSRRSLGSEYDQIHQFSSNQKYQLIDSETQWREVQRKQAEGNSGVHQANVIRPRSGYTNSGIETESEHSSCHRHKRKHRKHRSRSRSPSDSGKPYLPEELKKHLEFQLVDTEGMSEDQLREIPYTIVKTNTSKAVRVRLSPSGKPKLHHSSSKRSKSLLKEDIPVSNADSPPPPYSESPVLSDLSQKTASTSTTTGSSAKQMATGQLPRLPGSTSRTDQNQSRHSIFATRGNATSANSMPTYDLQRQHQMCDENSTVNNNSWLNNNSNLPNSRLITGLPPQPHFRRSIHCLDTTLNSSRQNNSKVWSTPEIRGAVGLPWTSISEQLQSHHHSTNNIHSTLDNARRSSNINDEHINLNQNILEHRSTNSILRPNVRPSHSVNTNDGRQITTESEKIKKNTTLAESGVLGKHTNTPNGIIAWPNEKQLSWQPKNRNFHRVGNLERNEPRSTPLMYTSTPSLRSWQPTPSFNSGPLVYAPLTPNTALHAQQNQLNNSNYSGQNSSVFRCSTNFPETKDCGKMGTGSNQIDRLVQNIGTIL